MGADIRVRKPKNLNIDKFYERCSEVPIDADINAGWIHFHYGYWGAGHAETCEEFVSAFCKKHKIALNKWNY